MDLSITLSQAQCPRRKNVLGKKEVDDTKKWVISKGDSSKTTVD